MMQIIVGKNVFPDFATSLIQLISVMQTSLKDFDIVVARWQKAHNTMKPTFIIIHVT